MTTPNKRIVLVAFLVLLLDQLSKQAVLRYLDISKQRVVVDGFFKFVHWGNTGAAWSLFHGQNKLLAVIAALALVVLYFTRHHFELGSLPGQISLGLISGGILGNLIDRLVYGHVIDFIRFYLEQRGGSEIGFPAFNVADSAICVGVGLVFLISWQNEQSRASSDATSI